MNKRENEEKITSRIDWEKIRHFQPCENMRCHRPNCWKFLKYVCKAQLNLNKLSVLKS